MNKNIRFFICFIIGYLSITEVLYAQSTGIERSDSIAINKALFFYKSSIKQQSGLYNGTAFYNFGDKAEGSSSFADSTLVNGKVIYNGFVHQNVPLNYDLYFEKLVSVSDGNLFSLISEKVSEFTIKNHRFINIFASMINGTSLSPGFYDLIYDGSIKIFAKRIKKLAFSTDQAKPYFFKAKTSYYLERDRKYEEIRSEGSLLDLFQVQKNEMKKQLKENNIKFKKDPERAIIVMATYFDSLKK